MIEIALNGVQKYFGAVKVLENITLRYRQGRGQVSSAGTAPARQ